MPHFFPKMVHKMGLTILVPFVIEIIQEMMSLRSSFKADPG